MEKNRYAYRRILCIRPDNMGDLLMSQPAIRALKETFGAVVTLLGSPAGAAMAALMPEIDDVLVMEAAWAQHPHADDADRYMQLIAQLKALNFDAVFIFTVYSQSPLPSAMLAYLAGIPHRYAFCRENPYALINHWIPDPEPYTVIRHQVLRDLALVAEAGAMATDIQMRLPANEELWPPVRQHLQKLGADIDQPWLLMHMCASEERRKYPADEWVAAARSLKGQQLIFTGSEADIAETETVCRQVGAINAAGRFSLPEFVTLIHHAPLLITVNTAPMHIAAATGTPVLALYAMTNPQHTPWTTRSRTLYFDVPEAIRSRNEVVRHGYTYFEKQPLLPANTANIVQCAQQLLNSGRQLSLPAGPLPPVLFPGQDA